MVRVSKPRRKTAKDILSERKKQKRQKLISIIGYILIATIFMWTILVWISYQQWFNLSAIVVKGDDSKSQLVRDFVYAHMEKNSLLTSDTFILNLDKSALKQEIKNNFHDIKDVETKLDITSKVLTINIKTRQPAYVICFASSKSNFPEYNISQCKLYIADEKQLIYKHKPATLATQLPEVVLFNESLPKLPEKFLDDYSLDTVSKEIKKIFKLTNQTQLQFRIKQPQMYVYLPSFYIKLDLQEDPTTTMHNLKYVANFLKKDNSLEHLEYIDARIPNKIFYKLKNEPEKESETQKETTE